MIPSVSITLIFVKLLCIGLGIKISLVVVKFLEDSYDKKLKSNKEEDL